MHLLSHADLKTYKTEFTGKLSLLHKNRKNQFNRGETEAKKSIKLSDSKERKSRFSFNR